jgi:hypothetical protein
LSPFNGCVEGAFYIHAILGSQLFYGREGVLALKTAVRESNLFIGEFSQGFRN